MIILLMQIVICLMVFGILLQVQVLVSKNNFQLLLVIRHLMLDLILTLMVLLIKIMLLNHILEIMQENMY